MAPVVNLHVTLLDKSQGTAVAGSASLDTCVWKLGEQVGMLNITTSPASNFGYIFRSAAGVWKSNQHPKLTLADAGVKNTGDMVQFMGDFEPFTPSPVVPGAVVELQMMLIGKGKTSNVTGKATLDKCVWELGYEVGLQRASETADGCGFAFGSKQWNSKQHPNLTLADAGVRNHGDSIAFLGDFGAPSSPGLASTAAPASPPSAPASPPLAPVAPPGAPVVDLKVTIDALSKSVTKICRTGLDKCVWTLGQDAGTAMLTCPASNGVVFSYAGRQWRSNQYPQLTLAEAGVHQGGEAILFLADFQPLPGATKSCGEVVEMTVTLLDRSKSWSKTAKAPLERSVWILGQEVGMRGLTTGPLSNYGYVFRCGGSEWRSNRYPNLTLAEAGVTNGATVEFLGDFEPPAAKQPSHLVEVHVELQNKDKTDTSTHKTSLDKGVWRFGEEAGVQKVLTSSLSHFGYVLHFGEQTWRKVHHPNLTLAEAGVKDGDTIRFTGDFEPK